MSKGVPKLAHYRIIIFIKPDSTRRNHIPVNQDDLLNVEGFIYNGEIFSQDMLRWMLPDLSEEKRREIFKIILGRKLKEAEDSGLFPKIVDEHE